jgi:hypothetical protein
MSHREFTQILSSIHALSPDQVRQLRDELDSQLAVARQPSAPAASEAAPAQTSKPIWERIVERSAAIPDDEWDKLPVDGAQQHDHYIYGTPKRPSSQ